MAGLVPAIHAVPHEALPAVAAGLCGRRGSQVPASGPCSTAWMAGTSPAMTEGAKALKLRHRPGVALPDMAGPHRWSSLAFGLGLRAAVNWRRGQQLDGSPGQRLTDQATGQTAGQRHSLFSIPMRWGSAPLTIAGVLLLAAIAFPPGPGASHDGMVQP